MQEIRKAEGLALEELVEHTVELLPDREEMQNTGIGVQTNNGTAIASFGAGGDVNLTITINLSL